MIASHLRFSQDKNYILKEAQAHVQSELLARLVKNVRDTYLAKYNPLDLEDNTVKALKRCNYFYLEHLDNFYWELAGVYRYKIGSNQLEFIFSGKSHYEKYLDDWTDAFDIWMEDFLQSPYFIRAVLEMAILQPQGRAALLARDRMKVYLSQYFNLKVYRYRGIIPIQAA